MTRRGALVAVAVTIAVGIGASVGHAQVVLRGGERVEDPVVRTSAAGVELGGARPRTLGWDVVREVLGEHEEDAAAYAALSDALWRARTRAERGDLTLAEPLFERAFAIAYGSTGPTSVVAAEGLLRCRLARGAHASALEPWLESLRLRRAGLRGDAGATANDRTRRSRVAEDDPWSIDSATGLAPALPPVWIDAPSLKSFPRLGPVQADNHEVVAFETLYRWAALRVMGEDAPFPSISAEALRSPGVRLVRSMVEAQHADADLRARARESLERDIGRDAGTWVEAWRRVAIGRSLLREDDASLRTRGMLELLHVPARFGASQPHLSAVALAEVCAELHARGEAASYETLRAELESLAPDHGAIVWLDNSVGGVR